ncbi:MAG: hypothetical protein IKR12_00600, partial [Clostridia bacterium]|nr:hypothetical protein [Clostridia bacterium]
MISLPQINNVLNNLQTAIDKKNNCSVFGLSLGEKAFFLSKQNRQIVLVTNSVADGIKYTEMFESFGKKCKTLFFNGGDYFSLHSTTISGNLISSVDALNSLANGKVDCIIMSPICLMQKYTPKDTFKKSVINIKKGQTINQKKLIQNLINIGYRRTEQISAPGEFMIRGDTFDIFSMLSSQPVRIEFFDDEVDTISYFNIETYRKTKDITKAEIVPTSQFVFDCDTNSQIFDNISNSFEKTIKTLEPNQQVLLNTNYEEFKINFDGKNYFQIKNWLIPFFKYDSIVSYFDSDALLVFDDVKLVYDTIKNEYKQFEDAYKNIQNSGDVLLDQKNYYLSENDIFNFDKQLLSFQQITTSNRIFNPTFVASFKSSAQTNYFGNYDLLVEDLRYYLEFNNTVIVCAGSKEHAKYLSKFLQTKNIDICEDCENGICDNKVNVVSSNIPYGAIFVEDNLVLIGTKELLKKSTKQKVQTSQNKKEEFTLPKIGDLVVHETYGIGKCVGIEKLKFSDFEKDYVI